jgi:Tyrosyl-DNA phosphodiesterase
MMYRPAHAGTHHTKLMVLEFPRDVRIIITTANLREDDFDQMSQVRSGASACEFSCRLVQLTAE